MLADDNITRDDFKIHTGELILNGNRFDGLGYLCEGNLARLDDEYWIVEPAKSLNLLKKRYWGGWNSGSYLVTDDYEASEDEHETDTEFDEDALSEDDEDEDVFSEDDEDDY